jgi:uncharacterized protein
MSSTMSPEQVESFLASQIVVRIATTTEERIYLVPMTCVYSNDAYYGFAHEGQKIRMMRANPNVCVEIDRIVHLGEWESVIAEGTYEELQGPDAGTAAQMIGSKLMQLATDEKSRQRLEAAQDPNAPPPIIYRIRLTSKSGRFER